MNRSDGGIDKMNDQAERLGRETLEQQVRDDDKTARTTISPSSVSWTPASTRTASPPC